MREDRVRPWSIFPKTTDASRQIPVAVNDEPRSQDVCKRRRGFVAIGENEDVAKIGEEVTPGDQLSQFTLAVMRENRDGQAVQGFVEP